MPEQNFQTFRGLLRGAICNRTQAQFANDSGISAPHLSRMLNDTIIFRPSNKTLHKIASAAKNGITYEDLKKALDDEEPNFEPGGGSAEEREERSRKAAEDFMPAFKERAAATMDAVCEVIKKQTYPCVVSDIPTHIGLLLEAAGQTSDVCLPISYEICGDWPYIIGSHSYASRWMSVSLTMADFCETAESEMVVFYSEIGGQEDSSYAIIQCVSTAVADISDVWGTPPSAMEAHREGPDALTDEIDVFEAAMNDPFYLRFGKTERLHERFIDTNAATKNELLLNAIFGQKTEYSNTTFGVGFWLKDLPSGFLEYVQAHRDAILKLVIENAEVHDSLAAALDQAVKENNPQLFVDELKRQEYDGGDDSGSDIGYGACIAAAMEAVTGFPFEYMKHTVPEDNERGFIGLSDMDCVILSEDLMHTAGIQREAALLAIGRTIRELGIPSFGDIMFTRMEVTFRKPRTYRPRVQTEADQEKRAKEESENKRDYCVTFQSGDKPNLTNRYAVKLKDGREMSLVYIKEHDIWLKYNKEWSHLIEAYDPRPLEPLCGGNKASKQPEDAEKQ